MTDLAVLEHAPPICRDCATFIEIGADRCPACGSPLCTESGVTISEREEGRCAFCRMADRGDDQLLSHDERGWLDGHEQVWIQATSAGSSRVTTSHSIRRLVTVEKRKPCECGCGMTRADLPKRDDLAEPVTHRVSPKPLPVSAPHPEAAKPEPSPATDLDRLLVDLAGDLEA